jgi:hypothetical protein
MEKIKSTITLLGGCSAKNVAGNNELSVSPDSEWIKLFGDKKSNFEGNDFYYDEPDNSGEIFISHEVNEDILHFNLSAITSTLVTIYDLAGNILNIQTYLAHRNSLHLDLNDHEGNYIVRVQLNYTQYRYAN